MKHQILAVSALVLATGLGSTAAQAHTHHWRFRTYPHHHRWAGRFLRHAVPSGGLASWYGPGFSGHRTANGERFNTGAFTAAHRYWPFGTRVRVTNQSNGRSVVVRINDRGPYAAGRVIDLSKASALAIGLGGVGRVKLARL